MFNVRDCDLVRLLAAGVSSLHVAVSPQQPFLSSLQFRTVVFQPT